MKAVRASSSFLFRASVFGLSIILVSGFHGTTPSSRNPNGIALFSQQQEEMAATTTASNKIGLSAKELREVVTTAARHDEDNSVDLHGIVWFEHVNLVVGSRHLAERFYLDLLGCSKDKSKSFHCNLGQQQFHLAETGEAPQRIAGSMGLAVPSLTTLRQRLREMKEEFQGTQFAVVADDQEDFMTVTCPWGNTIHLYDAEKEAKALQPTSTSPQKMVVLHAEGGTYANHRMSVRGNPGIRFVEIACPPSTAAAIAKFYQTILHCTVSTPTPELAIVCVGPGVHLVYHEHADAEPELEAMKGVHICTYVADFAALYQRLQQHQLIWTNPRFTHLDSCDTWEEALASRTLRFKDILDLATGEKMIELEHETRPMRHGQYLKAPFYEPK